MATQTGSALVDPNELRNREEVAREGLLQHPHASAGREPELLAEAVELEAVAMGPCPRGGQGPR